MAIDYSAMNTRVLNVLLSVNKHVPSVDSKLKSLIELRVSQINGYAYGVDLQSNEARNAGVPQQVRDCLLVWDECSLFSDSEMAALRWVESVTHISTESEMDRKQDNLLEHFSESETVDLALILFLMNCMNKMEISFGDKPAVRKS